MSKKIIHDIEALELIGSGINAVADAVAVTLGPRGRTAIFNDYSVKFTKDGVSVAQKISFSDTRDTGAKIAQKVASATVDAAGDGTTTAIVLFREIYSRAVSLYKAKVSPTEIREGIRFGINHVVDFLRAKSTHVSIDDNKIKEVATISANGDEVVGDLIAKMIRDVGKDGIITVEDGKSTETISKKVEGMKFDQGFKSNYFVNKQQKQICELENVHILVYDKKLDSMKHLEKIVEILEGLRGEPVLFICEDIADPVLTMLVVNSIQGRIKVCAVKAPGFGDSKNAFSEDIAIFTGATYIAESVGRTVDDFGITSLGKADKVIIDSKSTTIINGHGDAKTIKERCEILRSNLENETSEYIKNRLEDRIAKLQGKVGVIYVGGTTEAEQKELKDRVEDAVRAVKAAIIGGILPGGGSSYIKAAESLKSTIQSKKRDSDGHIKGHTQDFIWGVEAVINALTAPLKQSLYNAGLKDTWQTIVSKLQESEFGFGYDVAKNHFCDMVKEGIIDPTDCSVAAITNAGYSAAMIIGSGCLIIDDPDAKKDASPSHPGMGY
jgi:chaperonin GroEL